MKHNRPTLLILVTILIVIISGLVLYSKGFGRNMNTNKANPYDSPTLAAKAEYSVGDYYDGKGPSSQANSTSSGSANSKTSNLNDYIYPGSVTTKQTASLLNLESSASAEQITNWYNDKIREMKFNAKSLSQINTNGNIFNKLSAAKPGEKIEITIKKDQNVSKVLITVDRP